MKPNTNNSGPCRLLERTSNAETRRRGGNVEKSERRTGARTLQSEIVKLLIACVFLILFHSIADAKPGSGTTRTQSIVKTLHINQPRQTDSRYFYVPFQIGPHTTKISISYTYDHANGSNAVDIGLFDSRSNLKPGEVEGFRGWSGGRRTEFFLSQEKATSGYVPGEMPAGTWHIILGLYRVVAQGVDITFKIDVETDESKATKLAAATPLSQVFTSNRLAERKATSRQKEPVFPRWVSGDLHLHTVHSDGEWTIPELVKAAEDARLDFICITDHNTNSHHAEIDGLNLSADGLVVMRGEEVTTYGGHANAWGLPPNAWIDFRVQPGDSEAMSRIVSQTHRRGALISINHPFAVCPGCNWSYDGDDNGFDAVEVWNGSWDSSDERALVQWDKLIQEGRRITAVASSDSHRPTNPVGQAATHVEINGPLSATTVLKSLRAGRAYLTSTATAPAITFEAQTMGDPQTYSIGDVIRLTKSHRIRFKIAASQLPGPATIFLISGGQIIRTVSPEVGNYQYVEVDSERNSYFRLEVRDQKGQMLALTNPIYTESRDHA